RRRRRPPLVAPRPVGAVHDRGILGPDRARAVGAAIHRPEAHLTGLLARAFAVTDNRRRHAIAASAGPTALREGSNDRSHSAVDWFPVPPHSHRRRAAR